MWSPGQKGREGEGLPYTILDVLTEAYLFVIHCAAAAAGTVNGTAPCVGILGTGDSSLAHLLVMTNMCVWESPIRFQDYGYGHPCQGQADK